MTKWLAIPCLLLAGCAKPAPEKAAEKVTDSASPAYDAAFWKTWADGYAELASYDLKYPRYGAPRQGTAVAIFVAETFANSLRVKSDPGVRDKKDEFSVMKLNLVEDFQTGVYDYNLMLQSFVALEPVNGRPAGVATKVAWSSQEWCGNLFKVALFDKDALRLTSHSYFDGEGDQSLSEATPAAAVLSEDALMLWARGMAWPVLKDGETREVPALLSLQSARFKKGPSQWGKATLTRESKGELDIFRAKLSDGRERTFEVEKAVPHRIVKYSASEGLEATLLASERMKYWELNKPDGVQALKKLKLNLRPPQTM
ncbi:MAG: hypothetical protein JNM66_32700 [Bryobacterales bacterium]|nr:hypothetical protein [Bryobacterales bacterium]